MSIIGDMTDYYYSIVGSYLISIVLVALLLAYVVVKKRHRYWADRSIPYLEPNLIFGNIKDAILHGVPFIESQSSLYRQLAPHRFGGYFVFQRPILLIRDPELVKCVLTKDFSHFSDRNKRFARQDDVLSQHLFNLTGQKWKNLRAKLTSTFSSGKMKDMFHVMKESVANLTTAIDNENKMTTNEKDAAVVTLDMKELFARYSTDVIVSCAYGLEANNFKGDDGAESEFRLIGKKAFENSLGRRLFNIVTNFSPKLARVLNLRFHHKDTERFFLELVENTVKYREENSVVRKDFFNLLMELMKKDRDNCNGTVQNTEMKMTLELMAAQCFIFFLAGFDTSSGILGHCLLELSKQPQYQEKLRDEVRRAVREIGIGEITYDILNKIPYMDQVVFETMRMYPSLASLFRQCTKPYRIPNTDIVIEEGTEVFIPVFGLHRDPQYYPNPDVFNPDNFSDERKASRHHFTFLPFGEGPRICIGLRFGEMQVKLALTMLIQQYKFSLSPKMKFPTKFGSNHILTNIEGGIWLECSKC